MYVELEGAAFFEEQVISAARNGRIRTRRGRVGSKIFDILRDFTKLRTLKLKHKTKILHEASGWGSY